MKRCISNNGEINLIITTEWTLGHYKKIENRVRGKNGKEGREWVLVRGSLSNSLDGSSSLSYIIRLSSLRDFRRVMDILFYVKGGYEYQMLSDVS